VTERLDEERLEILRAWGAGLSTSGRDELRAAGKAIVMLVEEIDRLQADVWNTRAAAVRSQVAGIVPQDDAEPVRAPVETSEALARTLSERIARGRCRDRPARA
jgi:hypothetical protein